MPSDPNDRERRREAARARAIEAREKENRIVDLRKAGLSYDRIATLEGYSDRSAASKAVKKALSRMDEDTRAELRTLMVERCNDLYRRTTEILVRHHPVLYEGKPVTVPVLDAAGQPTGQTRTLDDDKIKLDAIKVTLQVQERVCRLLGLDMPQKVAWTDADGEPVEPVSIEVRARELSAQAEAFLAANPPAGPATT